MFLRNCSQHGTKVQEGKKLNPGFNNSEGIRKGLKNEVVITYVGEYSFSSRFDLLSLKLGCKMALGSGIYGKVKM